MIIIRNVTLTECERLLEALDSLDMEIGRVQSVHSGLWRSEWLGGDQDANNTSEPPARIHAVGSLMRRMRGELNDARHQVAMYMAVGDDGVDDERRK